MDKLRINECNSILFSRLSDYLSNYADCITESMVAETMRGCGMSVLSAFSTLAAGAFDLYDQRDIMDNYIRWIFKLQSADDYRSDPYYNVVSDKSGAFGDWRLGTRAFNPFEAFVYNDIIRLSDGRLLPQIGFFTERFEYPCISQNGREWMTLSPNEINTMRKPVSEAFGNVTTYGLGLGYFAFMCMLKPCVSSVTVIESEIDAISLFKSVMLPLFPKGCRLNIIHADAMDYAKEAHPCDYVFADIWHDPTDGIPIYLRLKSLEQSGVMYSYWIEETLKCYL